MIGESAYTGVYNHSIDPKNRMFLPATMRENIGDEVFVVKGVDKCIAIYPKDAWDEFTEKLNSLPEIKARRVKRVLMASAIKTKVDSQGRVLITQMHKTYAELYKNVCVVGVGSHIEVWDEDKWIAENSMEADEIAETLMSFGL